MECPSNIVLSLSFSDKSCLVRVYHFRDNMFYPFGYNWGKQLIVCIQNGYRPIGTTFSLVFSLLRNYWYYCLAPRLGHLAFLKGVIEASKKKRHHLKFECFVPFANKSIRPWCFVGLKSRDSATQFSSCYLSCQCIILMFSYWGKIQRLQELINYRVISFVRLSI